MSLIWLHQTQCHTRTEVKTETDNFFGCFFFLSTDFQYTKTEQQPKENRKIILVAKIQFANIATESTDVSEIVWLQKTFYKHINIYRKFLKPKKPK